MHHITLKVSGIMSRALIPVLLFLLSPQMAQADDDYSLGSSGGDPAKFGKWCDLLYSALRKNDVDAISKMMADPLRLNSGDQYDSYTELTSPRKTRQLNRKVFKANFNSIITHDFSKRMLSAQKKEWWGKDTGICFSNGMIWIKVDNDGNSYKIETINQDLVPPDIDVLLKKIHNAEKSSVPKNQLASMYSNLGQAYQDNWRTLSDSRLDERPAFYKKEEDAYRKALALRAGAAANSNEQARDMKFLAENLDLQKNRDSEAKQLYEDTYKLQKKILPPGSPALHKTIKDLKQFNESRKHAAK